ncbi:AgmX/PglI C-terminal domain-containing protein [Archangium violaceum]|uniref:AgmX/PglI C-terminal domain-containing protein n=1 Tax=Archangium violaceum TaxID=83451 RepID=UPI00193C19D9|nr:AgmX/PglI C-terminal domain-containing protein [Archangium violaceum]QRK06892.1 AgmX/PglI C-terminal domain-containing protein [Archangium violaceum]
MAAGKTNGVKLRITGPDGSVHEAVSESESIIVGSGAQAAVKILDPRVSNLHVMLKVESSGSVTAIDLGSENGTQVGGQRVVGPKTLSPGDVLVVGGSLVEVLFGDAELPPPPAGAEVNGVALQGSVLHPPMQVVEPAPRAPEVITRAAPPGLRARNAPAAVVKKARPRVAAHMQEPLPPDALPTQDAKVLQVQLLWGDQILAVQHFRDGVPVTIGEAKKNFFHVYDSEVGSRHVLAVARGELYELHVPESAGVIVTRKGDVRTKDSLRAEGKLTVSGREQAYTLGLHERAEVSLGTLTFVVRYVKPSPAVAVNTLEEADFTWFKIVSISMLAAGAVVAAMLLSPRSEAPSDDDIFQSQQRVAKLLVQPQKKIDTKKLDLKGVEEGAKAKDEEGKFGKEEAKKAEADPSKPGTPVVDKSKREKDRQVVGRVGLLGAFKGLKGGASDVFGPGGLGTGINNALGGLKSGAGMGDAQGVGGLGSRGQGTGGGGTALGLGGLGTKGKGRGAGDGGGIDLSGRGKTITKIVPGKTTVIGGLDKDVIAKIIRSHQNEIKYCYETELNKNPSLAGKVAVAFTIDPAGGVSEANVTETTLNNSAAENCMLSRIRRWKFPEPKGGGVVAVTYPWLFSPAGE